jgi:hypothetical protein
MTVLCMAQAAESDRAGHRQPPTAMSTHRTQTLQGWRQTHIATGRSADADGTLWTALVFGRRPFGLASVTGQSHRARADPA